MAPVAGGPFTQEVVGVDKPRWPPGLSFVSVQILAGFLREMGSTFAKVLLESLKVLRESLAEIFELDDIDEFEA
jgi:hypothetical protein